MGYGSVESRLEDPDGDCKTILPYKDVGYIILTIVNAKRYSRHSKSMAES